MDESTDPKISLDVGLSARASLEAKISAEIPPQATGRALDALIDLIRPITERRGLKADLIRLQREEVGIAIAQKTRERAVIEQREMYPLPNKFLVPFFEKATLEEMDSVLLDRWADLLYSAVTNPSAAHPRFIQILSELTGKEARLLRDMVLDGAVENYYLSCMNYDPSYAYQPSEVVKLIKDCIGGIIAADEVTKEEIGKQIRSRITNVLSGRLGVDFRYVATRIRRSPCPSKTGSLNVLVVDLASE